MKKLYFSLIVSLLFCSVNSNKLFAQFQSYPVKIIDDLKVYTPHNQDRRSYDSPTQCRPDTVEYPRYKASAFYTVTISENRGLGQFYDAPKTITLSGITFYAFVSGNPPPSRTVNVYLNVYRANADSLPTGSPLRSDTLTIDSTFGGGLLSNFERHAKFAPINIDFPYIVTIEADTSTLNVGVVTNDWSANDGAGEFLNCGSINNTWYRGRNLTIGTASFDADIVLYPHVEYKLGNDFIIDKQCFNTNDSVFFRNQYQSNIAGSKFYNRYSFWNFDQFCHRWNYGVNSFYYQSIEGGTRYTSTNDYDVTMISTLYYWRGGGNCQDTTTKRVYATPASPQVSGAGNKCEGDTAFLTVINGNQIDYIWTTTANDTNAFSTSKTLIVPNLTNNITYYARTKSNICYSNASAANIFVYKYPDPPVVRNDSICAGSRANLSAFASNNEVIEWFIDSNAAFPFFIGEVYQTPVLSSDTFFYVQANNFGCKNSERIKVSAFVSQAFAPSDPTVSPDTFACMGNSPIIDMYASVNSNDTLRWFNQASGGTPIAKGNSYQFIPTQRGVYNFYVDAWNGICGSSRNPIRVVIEDAPSVTSIISDTVCTGASAQISATVTFGQISWYDKSTGGTLVSIQNSVSFNNLQKDTTLYIETASLSCISPTRQTVVVKVNTIPMIVSSSGDTICSQGRALLKAQTNEGVIHWYDNLSDTSFLGTGNTYLTPQLTGNKTYYAVAENQGCASQKIPVTPLVRPRPFSGFYFDILTEQRVRFTPLTTTGVSVNWNLGDGNTSSETVYTHKYQDSGVYQVRLILTSLANSCKDTTINSVAVPFWDPASIEELMASGSKYWFIYPNPSHGKVSLISNFDLKNEPLFIYAMNGKLLQKQLITLESGVMYNIQLPAVSGIYIIQLANQTQKCIVE